jgi:hypothetical protein
VQFLGIQYVNRLSSGTGQRAEQLFETGEHSPFGPGILLRLSEDFFFRKT